MTGRRPRVVHVTTTDISLELLLGPQLSAFVEAGYEVVGASSPGPWVGPLAERGVRHVPLQHATRAMRLGQDVLALGELCRLFRRLRPEIVHTHNPKPGVYGRLAGRAAGIPVVVNTVHGLYAQPTDSLARRAVVYGFERIAATCSQAELVQNPEDVEVLRRIGIPSDRLHPLGNGVDLGRFGPCKVDAAEATATRRKVFEAGPDDVVVGLVGRLVVEKGYREVFAAARAVTARHPNVRFVVVGPHDPDKADALTPAELERASQEGGVRLLGLRKDMEQLYAAMDVYVLASHREGFPRSAMEAAASGLPIVATDIRGCRQVVDHQETGLLVPVCDSAALADAISRLVEDEGLRRALATGSRAKALREFDQRRQIDFTLATYDRLLRRAGQRPPTGG